MSNTKEIKNYLIRKNEDEFEGYLVDSNNNSKVIMLSGKWGCGKTYFWQHELENELKEFQSKEKKAYAYISLYGKSSIEEIESDIFGQIYFDANGGENIVTKTASTFTKYAKRYGGLLPSFDLSKLAEGLGEEDKDNKQRVALERLNNGGVICFDDFERKSKEIDLNDLFGFITQLTLNFQCKVVIILNDDVFEGKEKEVFTNVKEKTVSKFLYYNPSISELFNSIFEHHDIFNNHKGIEEYVCQYIKETNILNARIYNQVLDNLFEWLEKYPQSNESERRFLVFGTVYFILYHIIFLKKDDKYFIKGFNDKLQNESNNFNSIKSYFVNLDKQDRKFKFYESFDRYINDFEQKVLTSERLRIHADFLKNNIKLYKSKFFANYFNIADKVDEQKIGMINNFIETGILE